MAFNPKEHIIKLKGKDYLQVNHRVVWFREIHPGGKIATEIINIDPLILKASIWNNDGVLVATGHASANAGKRNVVWAGREVEKAETAAIGRALANAGFGTLFTAEDESDYLADSPANNSPSNNEPPALWYQDQNNLKALAQMWKAATGYTGEQVRENMVIYAIKEPHEFESGKAFYTAAFEAWQADEADRAPAQSKSQKKLIDMPVNENSATQYEEV